MIVVTAQTTLQNIHARVVGLDHRTKAKIIRAEREFYAEREWNSILVARVTSLEIDVYVANKKIADAEEHARVKREAANDTIRLARQAASIAKIMGAKKATTIAKRIRSEAAMVLETSTSNNVTY
jgi:CHASE3 domain sensor protein